MSKESRRQKIRWLEHVLWVLGTWTALGVALVSNRGRKRTGESTAAATADRTTGNADGRARSKYERCRWDGFRWTRRSRDW